MFRRGQRGQRRPMRQGRRFLRGMFGVGALFGAGGEIADEARKALDHANQLFDSGKYDDAGDALAELAELAETHQRPRRAAQMHYRAYQAYLKANDGDNALTQAREAIGIALAGRPRQAIQIAQQMIVEMQAAGFKEEAEVIIKEINGKLVSLGLSLATAEAASPESKPIRKLISNCPKCGARLRWMDDDEVECEYCGTIAYA
ncbi:MAG: zinc ribbon domain-containing protein [Chloroflexi bacterium]|nr:zinc ribbon domain-containing protein [Chloroflexota bacterium]